MAFPETPLPIKHEWLINGTWTDVTSRTKLADNVVITTGYSGEQATLASGTCQSTVFNRDQFFSNRVPTATNYGAFSKNVQCRVSVEHDVRYLRMADIKTSSGAYDGARATTADKAVLDITGDIDVRIDVLPDQWWGGRGVMLAGKYLTTGSQRSWAFWIHRLGYLGFSWSPDGTSGNRIDRYSDAVISGGGRKALRAALDVNNGSGGYTLTFYTSDMPQSSSVQVPNGTFESGSTTGWTPFDATFDASTEYRRSGRYSGLLTVSGSPSQAYVRPSSGATVVAGRNYQLRMGLYSETARTVFISVDWYDAGFGYLSTTATGIDIPANKWTMAEAMFLAPTSAVFAGHGPTLTGSPATGTKIWVDDINFYEVTWTQLGSQIVTTAATTSVFSSTADLAIGTANTSTTYGSFAPFPSGETHSLEPFVGKIYGLQLFSGIAGTLVADFNASAQNVGVTSWADDLGTPNTWNLNASAAVDWQDYRFWGEVTSITPKADTTGTDVTCSITAIDLLSRLRNGGRSIDSAIYSNLIRYADSATGTNGTLDMYFAMEDSAQATRPTPTVGRNGVMFDCTFTTDASLPASSGVLSFSSDFGWANGEAVPPSTVASTGVVSMLFYFYSPATPAASREFIYYRLLGGNVAQVIIDVENTTYRLRVRSDSADLLNSAVSFGAGAEPNAQWIAMRVMLTQNGGNVDYEWGWYPVESPVLYGVSGSFAGTLGGRFHSWASPAFASKTGWQLTHVAAMREELEWATTNFTNSTNAYVGEYPSERFNRLCEFYRIPHWIVGRWRSSTDTTAEPDTLGAQLPQTLVSLLEETVLVDGGYLHGAKDKFGIVFRMKNSIINRETVTVTYSSQQLSQELTPRDDLFFARNRVKAIRPSGGSFTHTKVSGAMNINEPEDDPEGIGVYDPGAQTFVVEADEQLEDYAREEVFLGTWDELRYVQASVQLARSQFTGNASLTELIRSLKLFSAFEITGFGSENAPWLPPDDAELLILGMTETLMNNPPSQDFVFNLMPYGPFRVNDLSERSVSRYLLGPSNSTLDASITGSATSFDVDTATGKLWKTGTVNIDIKINGEVMTVGTISGSSSPQTFSNVTRNVNNMATTKAHASGSTVKLANTWYLHR